MTLHWELGVLTTETLGKSLMFFTYSLMMTRDHPKKKQMSNSSVSQYVVYCVLRGSVLIHSLDGQKYHP